ncbi:mechanosensitive ion channel family protein [Persicitalea jodogahamensis]|uniref:Uncharacterized protein n=1 Tax=Persicitalea jodogahamensis TaxID=402147 RepID=A0A8J3D848_9BACT|nr:mechanosensitive ion channel family protein [Persicitalea jodogahamensis]GHB86901.1 hypothetical protein GCM10007390_48350 [Persicitalea jodogahamensis]
MNFEAFFRANAEAIYWGFGVTATAALLYYLTNVSVKVLINKGKRRGFDNFGLLFTVQRILKVFILLVLVLFSTYYFVDKDSHDIVTHNIKTITYLTFVAMLTIVLDSVARTVINLAIRKKKQRGENQTTFKFLKYVSSSLVYLLGIGMAAYAFPFLKGITQTAIGGAGIAAVIIGVASQEALANLVGGFFIILFKPFQVGDIIKISGEMLGEVTDITLRHTLIRDPQNKVIVAPNAIINKEKVINHSLGESPICEWIEIGISYDSNVDRAKEIMRSECLAHPDVIDKRTALERANGDPVVRVRVIRLAESSVVVRAWAWAKDFPSAFAMKCDLLESIKKRFDTEGVEIPFPYRTLVFKQSEAPDSQNLHTGQDQRTSVRNSNPNGFNRKAEN